MPVGIVNISDIFCEILTIVIKSVNSLFNFLATRNYKSTLAIQYDNKLCD